MPGRTNDELESLRFHTASQRQAGAAEPDTPFLWLGAEGATPKLKKTRGSRIFAFPFVGSSTKAKRQLCPAGIGDNRNTPSRRQTKRG